MSAWRFVRVDPPSPGEPPCPCGCGVALGRKRAVVIEGPSWYDCREHARMVLGMDQQSGSPAKGKRGNGKSEVGAPPQLQCEPVDESTATIRLTWIGSDSGARPDRRLVAAYAASGELASALSSRAAGSNAKVPEAVRRGRARRTA
jgi:hypothetical protein